MNPRLIGVAGSLQGALLALSEVEGSIGRGSTDQLYIADSTLSPKHCVVRRAWAPCTLHDLQSRNGTRVNGIPVVEEREPVHADHPSVRSSVLMFLNEPEVPEARPDQMF